MSATTVTMSALPPQPPQTSPPLPPQEPKKPHKNPAFSPLLRLASGRSLAFPAGLAAAEGRQLHARAVKSGALLDPFVQRSLVRMYVKCLAFRDARSVLDQCADPDIVSRNDLLVAFCRAGDLVGAREVFDGMRERNVVSWTVMIDGYAKNGEMTGAQELFDLMPERNQYAWSSLMSGYLRRGEVEVARGIFDGMALERNVVTWTAMISGYVWNGRHKEALELFLDMQESGLKPNGITLVSILPAVAQLGALAQGRWIHAYAARMGIELDTNLGSALLDMYSKCGSIDEAVKIFENLKHRELSAWNSIIVGLAAHGRGRDALNLFSRMREDPQIVPNEITFTGLLSACAHSGLVNEGWKLFDLFTSYYRLTPNLRHYGCMINLLARAGHLEEALEFLERMPIKPNSVIWKTLLSACRIHKNAVVASQVWRQVMDLGPQDGGFYVLLANIFSDAGQLDDAGRVRTEMNDQKIRKAAGRSWLEVDGAVHEFYMGRESFHAQSREIMRVVYEIEQLIKSEESND